MLDWIGVDGGDARGQREGMANEETLREQDVHVHTGTTAALSRRDGNAVEQFNIHA